MNRSNQFKITALLLGIVLLAVVGVLSFFIVHNAQWLIGDDAIVINHTGWGIPFSIWDTIKPKIGRFFPLAYMHENLVLLLSGDIHSALQHYVINMLLFLVMIIALTKMLLYVLKPQCPIDLFILFFSVLLCITRVYSTYLNVFSTLYNYYTLTSIFLLCVLLYYEKKKVIYAIVAILCSIYMVFCLECVFIIPLTLGATTLLFSRKCLSKKQVIFNIGLICVAIGFLIVYFFGIYLKSNTDSFYDPSHGTAFFENAVAILKGQKFLLLAALIWIVRQIILLSKKDQYHVLYDSLLWTSGAILLGGLILKLDWQMYYYTAILYALPSVLCFCCRYLGKLPTLVIIIIFAGLHTLKVPTNIMNNQRSRTNTVQVVEYLSTQIDKGKDVVWYETMANDSMSFDLIVRDWKKDCMSSYMQFHRRDSIWYYSDFIPNRECILLYPIQNDSFTNRPLWLPELQIGAISDILIYRIPTTNSTVEYEHPFQ